MSWTSEELEKLKNRDTRAFEKLYESYKTKIYNFFVIKSGGNQDLACELLSETFYSALNSVSTLKNTNNIQGWIFQIAVRRFNDYLRSSYRAGDSVNIDDIVKSAPDDTEKELIEKEKIALLYVALDKLKPVYRDILTMKYFEDRSEKEIADKIKKSVGAVEGLLFRARQSLKKELGNCSDLFMEGL